MWKSEFFEPVCDSSTRIFSPSLFGEPKYGVADGHVLRGVLRGVRGDPEPHDVHAVRGAADAALALGFRPLPNLDKNGEKWLRSFSFCLHHAMIMTNDHVIESSITLHISHGILLAGTQWSRSS